MDNQENIEVPKKLFELLIKALIESGNNEGVWFGLFSEEQEYVHDFLVKYKGEKYWEQ